MTSRTQPAICPATSQLLPADVVADLRTDHAGETGAVWIYKGILQFARDKQVRMFAERHFETESEHLRIVGNWLPRSERSLLLPLWCISGWLTGAVPAIFGSRAVYATIQAVETFVDKHYALQVRHLEFKPDLQSLRQALLTCQLDEVSHRDEAIALQGTETPGIVLKLWCRLVGWGSRTAVAVCRHL